MSLDQRVLGIVVERGPLADVERSGVAGAIGPHVPGGVHGVGRQGHLLGHGHVGRGKADRATPLVAGDNRTPDLVEPAQLAGGAGDIAVGQGPTDGGGRHRIGGAVGLGQQLKTLHLEAMQPAQLAKQSHIAGPGLPEMEIGPHHHGPGLQPVDHHPGHELLGRLLGRRLVEGHDHNRVDPARLEQIELLLHVGEQLGGRLRPQHVGRVGIERDQRRAATESGGGSLGGPNDGLVTQVDAVVGPDRHGMVALAQGAAAEVPMYLHRGSTLPAGPRARQARPASTLTGRNWPAAAS